MEKVLEKFLEYNKVWFGMVFIGSVLNAIIQEIAIFSNISFLTHICFLIGFVIGLIAKIRGKWLWV